MADNIFSYGIAINFFGNYAKETQRLKDAFGRMNQTLGDFGRRIQSNLGGLGGAGNVFRNFALSMNSGIDSLNRGTTRLLHSIFNLRNLLIGGAVGYAIKQFTGQIMSMGQEMEKSFAKMETALGTRGKVEKVLNWARIKAVETPFDLPEINQLISMLTTFGKTKDQKTMEKYFQAAGEFSASKSLDLQTGSLMLIRASMGNWRWMTMRLGIRPESLMEVAKNAPRHREELMKLAKTIQTGKAGSTEYSDAVIDFFSKYSEGGMSRLVKTLSGSLSNIRDLWSNTMIDLIGYSQQEGTLFNALAKSAGGFLAKFDQVYKTIKPTEAVLSAYQNYIKTNKLDSMKEGDIAKINEWLRFEYNGYQLINGELVKQIRYKQVLFSLGKRVGGILKQTWEMVSHSLSIATDSLLKYIVRIEAWLGDFRNNIAPMIVWLALLKQRVIDFFKGFGEGFMKGFTPFWKIFKGFVGVVMKLLGYTTDAEGLGKALGTILGALVGIKATGFILKIPGQTIRGITLLSEKFGTMFRLLGNIKGRAGGVFGSIGRKFDMMNATPVYVVNMPIGGFFGNPTTPVGGAGNLKQIGKWLAGLGTTLATSISSLGGGSLAGGIAAGSSMALLAASPVAITYGLNKAYQANMEKPVMTEEDKRKFEVTGYVPPERRQEFTGEGKKIGKYGSFAKTLEQSGGRLPTTGTNAPQVATPSTTVNINTLNVNDPADANALIDEMLRLASKNGE